MYCFDGFVNNELFAKKFRLNIEKMRVAWFIRFILVNMQRFLYVCDNSSTPILFGYIFIQDH